MTHFLLALLKWVGRVRFFSCLKRQERARVRDRELYAKEALNDRRHHDKEHAGPKPSCRDFTSVRITRVPFLVDFNRTNKSKDGTHGIH